MMLPDWKGRKRHILFTKQLDALLSNEVLCLSFIIVHIPGLLYTKQEKIVDDTKNL